MAVSNFKEVFEIKSQHTKHKIMQQLLPFVKMKLMAARYLADLLIVCNDKKKFNKTQSFAVNIFSLQSLYLLNKKIYFNFLLTLRNLKKKLKNFFSSSLQSKIISRKKKWKEITLSKEEEIQIIIHHWIRTLNIQLGWIKDFDKLVVNYVSPFVFPFFNDNKIFQYYLT
ncbi:hypothetical protein RFI_00460 [Reticulomyxa filosa]|uniref:Uncharacterized protein n=1 Tax=Reticulomyxa filosa TaxID=46433 RepID=X6PEE9_RETFI|nr:hypothetical protein RFI_00460 [Reticulomyxa filosa]|eukprot:ETO36601.1 hypothetical protein RFI_00460 [Reticulomyxa filosa]